MDDSLKSGFHLAEDAGAGAPGVPRDEQAKACRGTGQGQAPAPSASHMLQTFQETDPGLKPQSEPDIQGNEAEVSAPPASGSWVWHMVFNRHFSQSSTVHDFFLGGWLGPVGIGCYEPPGSHMEYSQIPDP